MYYTISYDTMCDFEGYYLLWYGFHQGLGGIVRPLTRIISTAWLR